MKTRNLPLVQGAKTREQLAQEYNISRRTLYSWLKKVKINNKGKLLTPKELTLIYEQFGYPDAQEG